MAAPILADDAAQQLEPAYSGALEYALTAALLAPLQRMANIVLDDSGPFASVFDRTITDPAPLRWGAMWAGVRDNDATEAQLRDGAFVRSRWRRGTVPAIRAAIQSVLTGQKNVRLYERRDPADFTVDAPYHLTVVVTTSEAPGGALSVARAIRSVLPARIILHVAVVDGYSWADLLAAADDWQDVLDNYVDWLNVAAGTPIP